MPSNPLTVRRHGQGPEVLLVHGGAGPEATWGSLAPLTQRFELAFAYRRGYGPSPPPRHGRQDFAADADDLAPLLAGRPHLVAHSYGGPGALIAAARHPDQVRSLTLIEPPLFYLAADDPEVARLQRLGEEVLARGLHADPAMLREFLRAAGADVDDGPLAPVIANGVRRAHGSRSPFEARPDLAVLRAARIPTLVASGGHLTELERVCDALAATLHAQRLVAPGAGHFVANAPTFLEPFERFLQSAH